MKYRECVCPECEGDGVITEELVEVSDLGLNYNTLELLQKAGFHTVEDLEKAPYQQIKAIPGLGEKRFRDIQFCLVPLHTFVGRLGPRGIGGK